MRIALSKHVWVDSETGKKWVRKGYCCRCGQCCGDKLEKCEFLRFKDESKGFIPENCYCLLKEENLPFTGVYVYCLTFPHEPAQCKNPSCTFSFEEVAE